MREFTRVLVANRGEIALRVLRALRALEIESVAVYSDADFASRHAVEADHAFRLPGSAPADTYLCADRLVEIARQCDAEAIHPGYGFLAENAGFARRCRESSIRFIGPSPEALATCGDKLACKALAAREGVPVIPASPGPVADVADAVRVAEEIGFPVLLKSAFGGGGRGIREATNREEVRERYEAARAEAESAFGRSQVFLEKRLVRPRHIEIQLLASEDAGEVVSLGERECSIQRRYQKLVEISPSPVISDGDRDRLAGYARAILRAVRYSNAGTVEFLKDTATGEFYFLEVNARLQVEHPVTELVTGMDLVTSQIHLARTGALPVRPSEVRPRGFAIECRINAEDPLAEFEPQTGTVEYLRLPAGPGIRVDTALVEGLEISPYYDSLLAKLVTWGSSWEEARGRGLAALREFRIVGIPTTIPFHREVLADPRFERGDLSTSFVQESGVLARLAEASSRVDTDRVAIAALLLSKERFRRPPGLAGESRAGPRPPVHAREGRFIDGG